MKETDDKKRRELHAAREHLMVLEHGLTFARMDAREGGATSAERHIILAQDHLSQAMGKLVERLAV